MGRLFRNFVFVLMAFAVLYVLVSPMVFTPNALSKKSPGPCDGDCAAAAQENQQLSTLHRIAPEAKIIVTATRFAEAKHLYDQGAAFVYLPRLMKVRELREIILAALDGDLQESREISIAQLDFRTEVLP